jgi:hypothetical protein
MIEKMPMRWWRRMKLPPLTTDRRRHRESDDDDAWRVSHREWISRTDPARLCLWPWCSDCDHDHFIIAISSSARLLPLTVRFCLPSHHDAQQQQVVPHTASYLLLDGLFDNSCLYHRPCDCLAKNNFHDNDTAILLWSTQGRWIAWWVLFVGYFSSCILVSSIFYLLVLDRFLTYLTSLLYYIHRKATTFARTAAMSLQKDPKHGQSCPIIMAALLVELPSADSKRFPKDLHRVKSKSRRVGFERAARYS